MSCALPLTLSLNWKSNHGKRPRTCWALSQPKEQGGRFMGCWWEVDMLLNRICWLFQQPLMDMTLLHLIKSSKPTPQPLGAAHRLQKSLSSSVLSWLKLGYSWIWRRKPVPCLFHSGAVVQPSVLWVFDFTVKRESKGWERVRKGYFLKQE